MSDCREIEPLLTSYVDAEAEAPARASVEAHLRICAPCRERVSCERAARDVLQARRAPLRACASEHLRHRCADTARQWRAPSASQPAGAGPARAAGAGATRALAWRTWIPLSLAATLLLAIGGVFFFGFNTRVEALAAQLALDHVKCFQFTPADEGPLDVADLGRGWERARGWPLTIPASAADHQLELIGLRRCASTEGLTAHLMYKWRGVPLSVYVLNNASTEAADVEQFVESLGQEAVIWSRDGRTYAVVARGQPSDLAPVITYVKISAR